VSLKRRAFVALQHVLPQRLVTAFVHRLARSERPWLKRRLIAFVQRQYGVDLADAAEPDAERYASFNAFFTRALAPSARPVCTAPEAIASPCDGTVSAIGALDGEQLLQAELDAKRHTYTLSALLADPTAAMAWIGGYYACLYLAPRDYHRVHMPCAGRLVSLRHVPGRLFSVNAASVAGIPGLFARNERVICTFETAFGPVAVIFVGALNVGSIAVVGLGDITPRRASEPSVLPLPAGTDFPCGAELGRFNLGSTVIVLFPAGRVRWQAGLGAGSRVRVGAEIGRAERRLAR
jgi:phosphatidylserine decarboxylase